MVTPWFILLLATLVTVSARTQSRDLPELQWLDMAAAKRDASYWNDCEFSPMSCLLRRRRSVPRIIQ
uniref:LRRNT_2 domain-containing protein n=1 Tax=Haemonchus contortus TaxID=6289 RepID=A0A7I4Z8J2_HAECO